MNLKSYLIALAAMGGILLALLITDSYSRSSINYEPFVSTFYLFFFLGGFIFTSRIFNELHQPEKSYQYLTLPASTLEKLISQWLFSAILYVVISYIVVQIIAFIGGIVSSTLFQFDFHWLNLTQFEFPKIAAIYIVIHSIFFLGACYFKNYNFIKTLLSVFILGATVFVISIAAAYLLFGQSGFSESTLWMQTNSELPHFITVELPTVIETIFWYGLAPFFLIVSYFKLKERQV